MAKRLYTKSKVITALKLAKGNSRYAARRLGVSYECIHNYIRDIPEINEFYFNLKAEQKKIREEEKIQERLNRKKKLKTIPTVRIKKALIKSKGYLYDASIIAKCHVSTIKKRIIESPILQELMEDLNTKNIEEGIKALLHNVKNRRDARAIEYYLKCKGKSLGFGSDKDKDTDKRGDIIINITPAIGNGQAQTVTINSKNVDLKNVEDANILEQKALPPGSSFYDEADDYDEDE